MAGSYESKGKTPKLPLVKASGINATRRSISESQSKPLTAGSQKAAGRRDGRLASRFGIGQRMCKPT
jgi:hypothetical protein